MVTNPVVTNPTGTDGNPRPGGHGPPGVGPDPGWGRVVPQRLCYGALLTPAGAIIDTRLYQHE